jgi:hypothetical protein
MTNSFTCTAFLLLLLTGMAGCDSSQSPSPTAPTIIQPPPTPQPNGHGEYVVDVTLSVVVFEMTPAGRTPLEGVQVWSSEHAMGVTDAHGVFRVKPVWVCPCAWAPAVVADMTSVYWQKKGYEDPAGQPDSIFHLDRYPGGGWRDAKISGDTRIEIELVKQ